MPLPRGGFKSLLGPLAHNRVRDCLLQTLLAEPSFIAMDVVSAYQRLRDVIHTILPRNICSCRPNCFDVHVWNKGGAPSECQYQMIWNRVAEELTRGIAAVFVTAGENTTVGCTYPRYLSAKGYIQRAVMQRVSSVGFTDTAYSAETLHISIMSLVGDSHLAIGTSSGSSSIFAGILQNPILADPPYLEYRLEDGQFHDGRNYYSKVYCEDSRTPRANCESGLIATGSRIVLSDAGTHSSLTITVRVTRVGLLLRTLVEASGKTIELHFFDTYLASLGTTMAESCVHDPKEALDRLSGRKVVTTSVATPVARTGKRISITLTHGNPEAQFLCCNKGAQALYQSRCCLNCAVQEAKAGGFSMVIQS